MATNQSLHFTVTSKIGMQSFTTDCYIGNRKLYDKKELVSDSFVWLQKLYSDLVDITDLLLVLRNKYKNYSMPIPMAGIETEVYNMVTARDYAPTIKTYNAKKIAISFYNTTITLFVTEE